MKELKQETRLLFSINAKKLVKDGILGQNQFKNRRYYRDDEITELIKKFNLLGFEKLLFTEKPCKNFKHWKKCLSFYMDKNSISRLLYEILTPNTCLECDNKIDFKRFSRKNKFEEMCSICFKKKRYNDVRLILANVLKEFSSTEEGKKCHKRIGEKNSIKLKEFFKTDRGKENIKRTAEKQSIYMKESIANGYFTPCITNTFTHWNAIIYLENEIRKFRSSWEACIWYCNQYLEYETLRIPYIKNNKKHNYIVDFYDRGNNIIYEIKPKQQWESQDNKMQQIIAYCLDNNYVFKWINEHNILEYVNEYIFFDDNKKQLDMLKRGLHM